MLIFFLLIALTFVIIIIAKLKKEKEIIALLVAVDHGDKAAKADLRLKKIPLDEQDQIRLEYYSKKAEENDAFAQYQLGKYYTEKDRNEKSALAWYERAAKNGNVQAMKMLADGYGEWNNEQEQDYFELNKFAIAFGQNSEAHTYWLKKAIEAGDGEAMIEYGRDLHYSEEGLSWFLKAAKSNDRKTRYEAYTACSDYYLLHSGGRKGKSKEEILKHLRPQREYALQAMKEAQSDSEYSSASSTLKLIFETEYQETGNFDALRNATYCYIQKCFSEDDPDFWPAQEAFTAELQKLGYPLKQYELNSWKSDSQNHHFNLPSPLATY